MGTSYLQNLVNPEVLADKVDAKLFDNCVFLGIADIDYTLSGVPGNTLYFPQYSSIGVATVVGEGSEISMTTLACTSTSATVKKFAKGVEITDEALLSGAGQPLDEAVDQIALALDGGVDNDIITQLHSITGTMRWQTASTTADVKASDIFDALELFGEDVDAVKVAVVPPAIYTEMRKSDLWLPASQIAAEVKVKGVVGEYGGCQIKVSNKLKDLKEIYIVKPGAIRIVTKRGANIESDRDITTKTTVITGDEHAVAYIYKTADIIRMVKKS